MFVMILLVSTARSPACAQVGPGFNLNHVSP